MGIYMALNSFRVIKMRIHRRDGAKVLATGLSGMTRPGPALTKTPSKTLTKALKPQTWLV